MATRKRHSPEQVVRKLTQADRMLGEGKEVADVCRELQVSEQTYYRWRNQFGGLKADDAKRLKDLERENSTLKRLLADAELEKAALKEIARGNFKPGTPAGGRAAPHRRDEGQRAVRLPGHRAEPNNAATAPQLPRWPTPTRRCGNGCACARTIHGAGSARLSRRPRRGLGREPQEDPAALARRRPARAATPPPQTPRLSTTPPEGRRPNRVWAVDLRMASSCESRDLFPQSSFRCGRMTPL